MAAAAEARAAWQRMANRYFVHEDAKRAPKLACSSSSSKLQHDSSNGEGANGTDNPHSNLIPLNHNPANSELPTDAKWWLLLQPNFELHKDFIHEQLNMAENELEYKAREDTTPYSRPSSESLSGTDSKRDLDKDSFHFLEPLSMISTTFMKHDYGTKAEDLKSMTLNIQQPLMHEKDLNKDCYEGDEMMDWKEVDRLISREADKAGFDLEPEWFGEKTEPWWRITNKDELASLVARKSLEHIENCDLPPPKKVHVSLDPLACLGSFNDDEILSSSFNKNLRSGIYDQVDHARSQTSEKIDGKCMPYDKVSYSYHDSERSGTLSQDDTTKTSDNDPSKAQLLEALRHSQTRAREAETAAQEAYNETEHVVKLFFKQASHLFAYKQWLRLLQLESLCLQLKLKEQQLSTLFPIMAWKPEKEDQQKDAKRRGRKKRKCNIYRYIVAFAVGLGLASAGLLLGWTLGWLLPSM